MAYLLLNVGKIMALPWLKLYRLMGKNARSVLGMVCLLAWLVPIESWAQGSLTSCGSEWHAKALLQSKNEGKNALISLISQWKEGTQAVFGGYSFDAQCQAHDACYSDCRMTQPDCDKNLLTDASAVCESTWNKNTCISDARTFFLLVSEFGGESFERAQANCPASTKASIVYTGDNEKSGLPGTKAGTATNSAETGSDTDAAHAVGNTTSGLSGGEVAKVLGSTREQDRAAAITKMVKQGAIRSPLTANELALILKGTTGGHRRYAIAQLGALMKSRLTASEAATVLGTVNELREQDRAAAIQSIAKANAYAELAGDAALILEGTTGGNRSFAIAKLANFFKKGLSASAVSEALGTVQQLREQDRAAAIRALVSASVPGLWGAEASEPLNGSTGGNRSYAIAQLAPRLRANLTGTEVASILGRPEELREQDRAAAIRSVVDARRLRLPFSGDELELVLTGTTGGHRSYAIGLLTQRR